VVTPEVELKALLQAKGLTQIEVARRMGISGAQLTRLFKGQRDWTPLTARAFAMATGIPKSTVFLEREEAVV